MFHLEIRHEIKNYLERNQALYQATNNVNYQDAEHLFTELNLIIEKSSSLDEKKDESEHEE
ncbi:MAG: hypothetical protein SPLM_04470 [Spiroplasma phoeniceum]|uniref:hypothetical protein n=1 Tax=Spiroplasma phoeniceum TaxID=47835 RepID=UPI0032702CA7